AAAPPRPSAGARRVPAPRTSGRPAAARPAPAVSRRLDAGEDDGDVVLPAGPVGGGDELLGAAVEVALVQGDPEDGVVGDHAREPVGAEQVAVAQTRLLGV